MAPGLDSPRSAVVRLSRLRRPFVVSVVVETSMTAARRASSAAFAAGADAIELNLASLRGGMPDPRFFRETPGPVYTSCRRAGFMRVYGSAFRRSNARSEELRMDLQLAALAAGSAGLDIEADTFAPCADEWTDDRPSIRRQRQIAAIAHRNGADVIFSWHPPRKLNGSEALRAARSLQARGADFVKIVERVRDAREALDSAAISLKLAEALSVPFIFLPLGPGADRIRPVMTRFGGAYLLSRPPVGSNRLAAQLPVALARALVDLD